MRLLPTLTIHRRTQPVSALATAASSARRLARASRRLATNTRLPLALLAAVGSGVPPVVMASPAYAAINHTYNRPGTYQFIVPEGVSQIKVSITGAGASGAGGAGYASRPGSFGPGWSGGGGGGGAAVICTVPVTYGRAVVVVLGRGGQSASGSPDGVRNVTGNRGGESRVTYVDRTGTSRTVFAESGHPGYGDEYGGIGGDGGATSYCAGSTSVLRSSGQPGDNDRRDWGSSYPGDGGVPGGTVPGTCSIGAGHGGMGGAGAHSDSVDGGDSQPGGNACIVLTY